MDAGSGIWLLQQLDYGYGSGSIAADWQIDPLAADRVGLPEHRFSCQKLDYGLPDRGLGCRGWTMDAGAWVELLGANNGLPELWNGPPRQIEWTSGALEWAGQVSHLSREPEHGNWLPGTN